SRFRAKPALKRPASCSNWFTRGTATFNSAGEQADFETECNGVSAERRMLRPRSQRRSTQTPLRQRAASGLRTTVEKRRPALAASRRMFLRLLGEGWGVLPLN